MKKKGDKAVRSKSRVIATEHRLRSNRQRSEEPVTRKSFEDALKRASRKVPAPASNQNETHKGRIP